MNFDQWIETLEKDVVQGEYGYEPGEFTVYPDLWRASFDEGLTPSQAFDRALAAADEARKELDREAKDRWSRIQEADRLALSRTL